jgi:LacI family transcriptional regulator
MAHRFPIKEIARQAGLSTATVDRVLNDRPNVSPATRLRVRAAIDELRRQEGQLAARSRRLFVDFVIEAPERFAREVRRAAEAVLPELGMGVFRPRFTMQPTMPVPETVATLDRIAQRGAHGVCLKAQDVPEVRAAVDRLAARNIPVVTLVTDLAGAARVAYAGLDNASASRTAAHLMRAMQPAPHGTILVTRSHETFFGEAERLRHFSETLRRARPDLTMRDLSRTGGLPRPLTDQLEAALPGLDGLAGVYSIGGGNAAIRDVLGARGIGRVPFIAHDLDRENAALLRDGALDFVLHHDLRTDARNVFRAIAAHHGLGPALADRLISDVQVVTPFNLPQG